MTWSVRYSAQRQPDSSTPSTVRVPPAPGCRLLARGNMRGRPFNVEVDYADPFEIGPRGECLNQRDGRGGGPVHEHRQSTANRGDSFCGRNGAT
jgi:hypothetical protein